MTRSESRKREDEILLRMLKTPPQPHDEMKVKNRANPKTTEDPQWVTDSTAIRQDIGDGVPAASPAESEDMAARMRWIMCQAVL